MMCLFRKKNMTVQGSYSSYILLNSGTFEMSTRYVIVRLASVITGTSKMWVRERMAEKSAGIFFDPACKEMDSKKQVLNDKVEKVEDVSQNLTLISIAVAISIVIFTAVFIYLKFFRKTVDTVLICGLSDSGKTCIFSKVAKKNSKPVTYTSLQENVMELNVKGNNLKVFFLLSSQVDETFAFAIRATRERSTLRGILFVVDSASFSKRARDVAEFLYDVALESAKMIPIMIACNKQDLDLAKTDLVIRTTLEKEFTLINKSRSSALAGTDGSDSKRTTLTDSGEQFTWNQLPKPVEFVSCTASDDTGEGIEIVRKWIIQ
ncbi:hypothetical protein WR25_08512 [Diploscapter pachys]|uniref:Signal recognition particle receptor subunit beta n=1 Tax=Diploscapter pachys TaxID=2018661 RepID=A0A2A2LFE8_9BILA|nr:hypothetical protein WR25_08512 [Diploscapter pachys]